MTSELNMVNDAASITQDSKKLALIIWIGTIFTLRLIK